MTRALSAALLLLFLLTGCSQGNTRQTTVQFTEAGVKVTIDVSKELVKVTFHPTRPRFHIYSLDLPLDGIDGLGVPTRLATRAGLTATGKPSSDRQTIFLATQGGARLPVYPDGPVTISLPVRRVGELGEVIVSYGACSRTTCLAPVTDRVTKIPLHAG
ncbi:hypothetical protein [Actinomadura sp. 6N118]|uniref:hypothetical protein n=1 Tax=Actinomadura sp. 6N118 TaxID=3375151 RepID=UPI003791E612